VKSLIFAFIALSARTAVLLPALARTSIAQRDRRLIAWFGPRGLSSLLLILLPVFAGMPGSVRLFQIACLVVLLSVLLHGAAIALFLRKDTGPGSLDVTPEPKEKRIPSTQSAAVAERITIEEMRQLEQSGEKVIIADVRTERSYAPDNKRARGAVRLPPDDAVRQARQLGLDHHGTVVLYCA
jgi:sodium/hydrogen antiporter